ncbi:MAG TPA: hypothetical protein ENK91_02840 [Bacteroidetes bacterium]|nr:hypothetical protein [Arcobacter sp.]HHH52569.1 hypothetical protein [Bacteroidota bacterium]
MKLNDTTKGYLWVFVAILAVSNVYIFSKAALNQISIVQFGFYWFGFGLFWNILISNNKVGISKIKQLNKKVRNLYLLLGVLEIISTTAFFYAIMTIENPSVTSFLGNLTPIFVTIFGIIILKERFNFIEMLGAILTLLGAFIISYKGNDSLDSIFLDGTQYILISSLVSSIATIIVKYHISKFTPALLSINRIVFIFTFAALMMIITKQSFSIPMSAVYATFFGSLLGPFLTAYAGYNALRYIEASKRSILSSSRSLFVLLGAYLYFGNFPKEYQIIGGLITIVGVILISFGKMILKKRKA